MHLPNSWGNPDKEGEAEAGLCDGAGGKVVGGVGREEVEANRRGVRIFLLGVTLSCSSSTSDLSLFPPAAHHSLG
jgi:hypothetical protein